MKKLITLLLVFIAVNSNAQWFTRQFSVNSIDELNEKQLNISYTKAEKITKTGVVMTISGITAIIVGEVIYLNGEGEYEPNGIIDFGFNDKMFCGGIIIGVGAISTGIGIPLWMVGGYRKYLIKGQLAKFNDTSYIPSIGIRITF
jgi:hypothetical protein